MNCVMRNMHARERVQSQKGQHTEMLCNKRLHCCDCLKQSL